MRVLAPPGVFRPYLPRLALEWRVRFGEAPYGTVEGSLVGLDVSGFTALSERLVARGRLGAEEFVSTISSLYADLIEVAGSYGGDLLKFRGDALLTLFDGDAHEERATSAALAMQARLAAFPERETSVGPVSIGMHAGVASGECRFVLAGSGHRELIVCGPVASLALALEDEAENGEVLVSSRTADALPPGFVAAARDDAFLVARDVSLDGDAAAAEASEPDDVESLVSPLLRERIATDAVESEHRYATAAFVKVHGTDSLDDPASLVALARSVSTVANELDVTWLESDIDDDAIKLYLVAGAPASSGGDEERMLRTVRRIVDEHPDVSVGVNRGAVLAGAIGSSVRRTYAVMGDPVNVAARLTARAEHGEILASGDVLQRSRAQFESTHRQFLMKGKARALTGYSVGALVDTRQEERAPLPLVGRRQELAMLSEMVAAARLRQSCALEIVGEAGMGKSRLVAELPTLAVGFQHLHIRCEEYAFATPFGPVSSALRPLVGILADDSSAAAGEKLGAFVRGIAPDLVPWLPLLAVPFDAHVGETPEVQEIDPVFRRDRLHDVTEQFLSRLLLVPTTIVVEDAHWLDDASQLLLRRLARPAERPWFVVVTRRPDGNEIIEGETIELAPLPADDARTLALAATDAAAISDDELAELTRRAGGNPLFVRELAAAPRADALPESIEVLLTSRIDTLAPADRQLLRHAAVIGRTFDLDLLAETLDDEHGDDPERWRRLSVFVEWDGPSTLTFTHDLVRAAAYEGLSYAKRREIHLRVGEALARTGTDDALLSLHYLEGGDHERAWDHAVTAADDARAKHANVDAAELYERALRAVNATPSAEELARVAEALGDVYEVTGRYDEADAGYARAEAGAADPTTRARLHRKRGVLLEQLGRYADALALYELALGVAGADEAELVAAENATAVVFYRQGKLDECVEWTERAVARAKSAGDRAGLARAYLVRGTAEGDLGGAADEFLRLALPVYEELGDLVNIARVYNNLGVRAYYESRWNDSSGYYAQASALADRTGHVVGSANATLNEAEIRLDQGRLDEAERLLADALRQYEAAQYGIGAALARADMGRLAAYRGEFAEGRARLAEARAFLAESGSGGFDLDVRAREAELDVLEGDHAAAVEIAVDALAATVEAHEIGVRTVQLERILGYAHVQARDREAALPHLEESLRLARELGAAYEEALTLKALTDTGLGDGSGAREIFASLGVVSHPLVPLP